MTVPATGQRIADSLIWLWLLLVPILAAVIAVVMTRRRVRPGERAAAEDPSMGDPPMGDQPPRESRGGPEPR